MQFYASEAAEALAVRRAAKAAGCRVCSLTRSPSSVVLVGGISRLEPSGGPLQTLGKLVCPDGWVAARLLLALAGEDSRTSGARSLALRMRSSASDDEAFAREILRFVQGIGFARERGEIFQSGGHTIARGVGDCDDHFRLVYAIAAAGGLRAALAVLHRGENVPPVDRGPTHAVCVVWLYGGWRYLETTLAAELGENPNDAARRLGLTNARTDIAKEVRIMTEAETLPPAPAGFAERNSAAQVAIDARALQRLGYLASSIPAGLLMDPTYPPLRLAVLAFQAAVGIGQDGLLGPVTRSQIDRELHARGIEGDINYSPNVSTMGSLGGVAAPVPVKLSAHLSPDFFREVRAMVARFAAKGAEATAEDFLLCWLAESGIKNVPNRQGYPFGGLNQMGPSERQAAGFRGTFGDWLSLSPVQQLPFVERYYVNKTAGRLSLLRDATSVYVVNFAPAFISHAAEASFPLFKRREDAPAPDADDGAWEAWRKANLSDPYAANRKLDRGRKGYIAVGDLRVALDEAKAGSASYWSEVVARLDTTTGDPSRVASITGILLLLSAMGGAAWTVARS